PNGDCKNLPTRRSSDLDANNPNAKPVLIQARVKDLLYAPIDAVENVFYIRTNLDAKNFKVVVVPVATPSKENWKDFIPHKPNALDRKSTRLNSSHEWIP